MLRAAESRYREAARLAATIASLAGSAWDRVPLHSLDSWQSARLASQVTALQLLLARGADAYLTAVLDEQGLDATATAAVNASTIAGVAGDGRSLVTLLDLPRIEAKVLIGNGMGAEQAFASARESLRLMAVTAVQDAGRAADSVAMVARPSVDGYVRMLNTPSCPRCVVLAGRFYRWNAGFQRHPKCFPAGVVVSGPTTDAASRRWFQGELVVLTTASGQNLSLTGNHPVLTSRGWVPANLLHEGDEVVRSTLPEGARPLVRPDHHEVPSRIEDVWGALSVAGFDSVESTAKDFHGDGQQGQVHVVRADRALHDGRHSSLGKHGKHLALGLGARSPLLLDGECVPVLLDLGDTAQARRPVGLRSLGPAFFRTHLAHAEQASLAHAAALHTRLDQAGRDGSSGDAVLLREAVLAGSGLVRLHDGIDGQVSPLARWDAPGDAFSVETADGYASLGRDLLHRLSGQVELDRVVQLRRVEWSGHVYSLTSSEGWHSANSLIVSNCDCRHVPSNEDISGDLRTSPLEAIKAGQVTGLSEADTKAILDDGADVGQVINAHRGLYTADAYGVQVKATTEGVTKRAVAGSRFDSKRSPRLRPESIYAIAKDREDALRLLRRFGYLL